MASVLVIIGAFGEMHLSALCGKFIDTFPMTFMLIITACNVFSTIVYLFMQCYASSRGKRQRLTVKHCDDETISESKTLY